MPWGGGWWWLLSRDMSEGCCLGVARSRVGWTPPFLRASPLCPGDPGSRGRVPAPGAWAQPVSVSWHPGSRKGLGESLAAEYTKKTVAPVRLGPALFGRSFRGLQTRSSPDAFWWPLHFGEVGSSRQQKHGQNKTSQTSRRHWSVDTAAEKEKTSVGQRTTHPGATLDGEVPSPGDPWYNNGGSEQPKWVPAACFEHPLPLQSSAAVQAPPSQSIGVCVWGGSQPRPFPPFSRGLELLQVSSCQFSLAEMPSACGGR